MILYNLATKILQTQILSLRKYSFKKRRWTSGEGGNKKTWFHSKRRVISSRLWRGRIRRAPRIEITVAGHQHSRKQTLETRRFADRPTDRLSVYFRQRIQRSRSRFRIFTQSNNFRRRFPYTSCRIINNLFLDSIVRERIKKYFLSIQAMIRLSSFLFLILIN